MHNSLILASACMAAGLILSVIPSSVAAAPRASLAASKIVPGIVDKAGWRRRYYRRHWYLPPPPYALEPPVVIEDVPFVVPIRPLSCGEFHYWNGEACVDARYNDPYLGPR